MRTSNKHGEALISVFLALAKTTEASTLHCGWTKSSTSPLSWTPHWSVSSQCNCTSANMLKLSSTSLYCICFCTSLKHDYTPPSPKFTKDVVARLNSVKIDLRGIILLEAEGKQNLLDFSDAGLLEINYADYLEEVIQIHHKQRTEHLKSQMFFVLWPKSIS